MQTDFAELFEPHRQPLGGYLRRLVGHREDADDLLQDTAARGIEKLGTLRDRASFKTWIYQIATRAALDHLRKKKRWRPYSQSYYEKTCEGDDVLRKEIVDIVADPEFSYDVREHIAFCLACVGRSLDPEQQAALVLREILETSNRESADILGLTESAFRHRLSAARASMRETFDGLCSLVNKQGVCRQCASFRRVTADGRRGPSLPIVDGETLGWQQRVDVARSTHFAGGVAQALHDHMFERLEELEERASEDSS